MRCLFTAPLTWAAMGVARLPQPALLGLGRAVAWLVLPFLTSRRRIAAINIALCFPELDGARQAALVRGSLVNTVVGIFELMRAWYAPPRVLVGLARIEGMEHLREALQSGRGVLLMCGHFTPSELAARLLGEAMGRPIRAVFRPHNNACLERWFNAARSGVFGPAIAKKDVRALLRTLLDGEPLAYSADQNFNYQSAFVPFFGVPAATLTVTPELVRRGRAVLLPMWYRRDEDGRYTVRIGPTWDGWPSGDLTKDAARYMHELEAAVRRCPDQYLWAHRRFKTRPAGEPPLY